MEPLRLAWIRLCNVFRRGRGDEQRLVWPEQIGRDLRHGVRVLTRNRTYSIVAIGTLALGIGASAALFSVIDSVLLHPFPYANPQAIWSPVIRDPATGRLDLNHSWREYTDVASLPAIVDAMATAYDEDVVVDFAGGAPEDLDGVFVSDNAFPFLGVKPLLGRVIDASDLLPNGDAQPVVVLSYRFWKERMAGDPTVLGRHIRVGGESHVVVGVMPPRFGWYTNDAFWLPMSTHTPLRDLNVYARLRPGVTPTVANQQLTVLVKAWTRGLGPAYARHGFVPEFANLMDITRAKGRMTMSLRLLGCAVGFLLLIACTNVANLQLARAMRRGREIAVRVALGATRARIVRQMLTESLVLALVASVIGILLAVGATHLIAALIPPDYLPNEARIALNGSGIWFALLVAAATGLLFGLAPALHSARVAIAGLKTVDGTGAGRLSPGRLRRGLVIVQLSLSLVLLVAATLTTRGFLELSRADLGFRPDRLLRIRLPKNSHRFPTLAASLQFDQTVLERLRRLPGVEQVSLGNIAFPLPGGRSRFEIPGRASSDDDHVLFGMIDADYLRTFQVSLQRGRDLTRAEVDDRRPVCLINAAAARLWPADEDPLGRTITLAQLKQPSRAGDLDRNHPQPELTVVGIIGDERLPGTLDVPPAAVFVPYTMLAPPWRMVALRTAVPPDTLLNAVRAQIRSIDPGVPIDEPKTGRAMITEHLAAPRFNLLLFGILAVVGLLLALSGTYGVVSYIVAQRTREFAIRVAVGASGADILSLVFGDGVRLVAGGVAIGTLAALALSRYITSEVFIRTGLDLGSAAIAIAALTLGTMAAILLPARRAARSDPLAALKAE